ncbi:hypothetical protein [Natronobiforma cellulositropha]|uniref:hypothetical protein n=1 Tax=Natronobiforma cellulositropha TaxID=1679076 RepID=UPI0021D5C64A|nr:hypothetical protein [Natronobiforma cellulositropha]
MDEITLGVPAPVLESLPDDGANTAADMQQAVAGWERRLNGALADAEDEREETQLVARLVDRFEERRERFDAFVPELRAWGQSPVYAIAWRTLYADLIAQLYAHDDLGERLERERSYRLVEDGIRLRDR